MAALKEPPHLALNPFGSVPTYEEGDPTLVESGAIVLHLADRHVNASARPSGSTGLLAPAT